jgi:hypothetical protein
MKKTSLKEKFFITLAVVLLLNGVSIFLLLNSVKHLSLEKKALLELETELALVNKRIENLSDINALLDEYKENHLEIKKAFLTKETLINFVEELELLAEKTKLNLETSSVHLPGGGKEKPVFIFKLSGPFQKIFQYLILLENNVYLVQPKRVYLHRIKDKTDWEANFEVELLSFENEEES